jgi:hypothetical protein
MNLPGEFGGEASLAHPRLTGQEGDPQLARCRFLPQLPEPFQLAVPADEDPPDVSQEGRQRDRGLTQRLPLDLDGRLLSAWS